MVAVAAYHLACVANTVVLKCFASHKLPTRNCIHYENAQFIAGSKEGRRLRIMRAAHKIKSGLLNFPGIAILRVVRNSIPDIRIFLVTVGSAKLQFLTV